jgi:2-polyprenyl-6-methoxyphenol hydroxylase-like FAD-dependent oxidoreductase
VSYSETEHGVTVETDKGETIEGSILIGADGVHSTVRKLMADEEAKSDPATSKALANCMIL